MYRVLAAGILVLHLLWIFWVIFGALFTRRRQWLGRVHVASLVYSIVIEVAVLPCPLTRIEQWAQARAGMTAYQQDFLVHYLESVIYPGVPYALLVSCAVAVCLLNLGVYCYRWMRRVDGRCAETRPGDPAAGTRSSPGS